MKLKEQLISEQNILKANIKNNIMAKTAIKSYSLAEMKDKYVGKKGTVFLRNKLNAVAEN